MRVAFLQVGADYTLATILVKSIRQHNPRAELLQCSDSDTPPVPGVDEVLRVQGDSVKLMALRMAAFSTVSVDRPTLFLDTDMICVGEIHAQKILGDAKVAVCAREFDKDAPFNIRFPSGMNMIEHAGKSIGAVYPYLACTTAVYGAQFWAACNDELKNLHPQYHAWYGDQEAIRNLVHANRYSTVEVRESIYACLPERIGRDVKLIHFKGPKRKAAMLDYARRQGL
jgi:hypothetical protein